MLDETTFDARLEVALREFASEVDDSVDSTSLARSVVRAHRRRRGWLGSGARWAVVVALLAVAALVATLVGGRLERPRPGPDPQPPQESNVRSLRLPAELHGVWQGNGHRIDLRADVLVATDGGTPIPAFGATLDATRRVGVTDTFTVRVGGSCGIGVYTVVRRHIDELGFTARTDPCTDRRELLASTTWTYGDQRAGPELGPFVPGVTYDSGIFTEPFTFVMPAVDGSGANDGLPGQFRVAWPEVSAGGLRFGGPWWSMTFIDDLPVNSDLCDETSDLLADLPSTPVAIGDWLRRDRGARVSPGTAVPVDGRTALRFDIDDAFPNPPCTSGRLPAGGFFPYSARAYAIPTGHDTILLIGGSDGVNWVAVGAAMESFVRSMDFR
jgi:hypothetical protein